MKLLILLVILTIAMNKHLEANEQITVHNPFRIDIDPMESLLLVALEKDPDSIYVGFEPQVFDDEINGTGHLVIAWRHDGKIDVYHQPTLSLDPLKYDIAGGGLANMLDGKFSNAYFEVNDYGVQADYRFYDLYDREIIIKINERNPKKRKPFGLLAPMGHAAKNPSAMPLVMMHDFYFVRHKHTDIELSIDDKEHAIDILPIPMDKRKMTFIRYSPKPLIVTINQAVKGELVNFTVNSGDKKVYYDNYEIELDWRNNLPFIMRITRNNHVHPVKMSFKNGFPDIKSLENGAKIKDRFEIEAHSSLGRVAGHYEITKSNDLVTIVLIPSKGWKPRPDKFSLRFLYTVNGMFKNWPKTYKWTAQIQESINGQYSMISEWIRTK